MTHATHNMDHVNGAPARHRSGVYQAGLLHAFWRRRWTVLACIALCMAAGGMYLVMATPLYEAACRVYIEPSGPSILASAAPSNGQPRTFVHTQAALIESRPTMSRALMDPRVEELESLAGRDDPADYLQKITEVRVGESDDVITVRVTTPDPEDAAVLANAIVDATIQQKKDRSRSTAREILDILGREKIALDHRVRSLMESMLEFKRESRAVSFGSDRGNVYIGRLSLLSEALTAAELETVEARSALEQAQALRDEPYRVRLLAEAQRQKGYSHVPADPESTRLRNQLNELQMQMVVRRQDGTADSPAIQAANRRVEELERQLAELDRRFADAYLAAAEQRLAFARDKEGELRLMYEAQTAEAQELSLKAAQYEQMQDELERARSLADTLAVRIREIDLGESAGAMNVQVLEPAQADDNAVSPDRKTVLAVSFVIGLLLGLSTAQLRDWVAYQKLLAGTQRSPQEHRHSETDEALTEQAELVDDFYGVVDEKDTPTVASPMRRGEYVA